MNSPHAQPSYLLHGPLSNHSSNMNKSKPQAQSQSTHQPSMCTRAIENPPPCDQSHPYEMQLDGKAGSDQEYYKSK